MKKLLIIGDVLDLEKEEAKEAFRDKNKVFFLESADNQIARDVDYINIRAGKEEEDKEMLSWTVKLIQESFNDFPLVLSSENKEVIKAGLKVYNPRKKKAIVNSADAGKRKDFLNLAADYDAGVICLCVRDDWVGAPRDTIAYCNELLERGMDLGINPEDMFFDPSLMSLKQEQEKLPEVLKAIHSISELKLNSIIKIKKISQGLDSSIKEMVEASFITMALAEGLNAVMLDPYSDIVMGSVIAGENILNKRLYTPAELKKYGLKASRKGA